MANNPLRTKYVWMDGRFVPFAKATIPLLTHSFHYGSAVFEGERFYKTSRGSAVFRLREHTDRLFLSATTMGIRIPYSKKQIIAATRKLIKLNELQEGYIRPIAYYGEKMGLLPKGCPVHLAIAAWPWGKYLGSNAVKIKITRIMRFDSRTFEPRAKVSGYYANSIIAALEAHKDGFDEALLLDTDGFVAEGPGENIFIVRNKTLFTPKTGSILLGITRSSVIRIASDLGFSVREKKLLLKDVLTADEAFFTGTAAEVTAIGRINNKILGNGEMGPITKKIKNLFNSIVHGQVKKYNSWLTYV